MPLIMMFFAGLGLWLFGEYVAFSLVAQAIGLDGAILATLATSLAGVMLLRRLGASARESLMSLVNANGEIGWFAPERLGAGLSAGFGAVLLILPGFLSDAIGLLLIARAARIWHLPWNMPWATSGPRFGNPPRRKSDDVIELSPQDYRHIDEPERR
jgi:UPF0716 family protein affecting phage T7 exclusion